MLHQHYNTLLLHDVVARLKINDVTILQDIVRYIMANIGSLLSPNKIANSLVSAGRKIDNKTVERYYIIHVNILEYQSLRPLIAEYKEYKLAFGYPYFVSIIVAYYV